MNNVIMGLIVKMADVELRSASTEVMVKKAIKMLYRHKYVIIIGTGLTIHGISKCKSKIRKLEKRVTELEYKLADPEDIEDSNDSIIIES